MPENVIFSICESLRNIRMLTKESVYYLFFLLLSHLLVVLVFTTYINTYYFRYISIEDKVPLAFNNILYILLIVVFVLFIYTNQRYIKKYLENNKNELTLIKMLKGNTGFIKAPLILTCFSLNLLALLLTFNCVAYFYRYLMKIIEGEGYLFSLLDFNYFNTSLFIIILVLSKGVLLSISFYLFKKFEK